MPARGPYSALAAAILNKALEKPELSSDRIVSASVQKNDRQKLIREAWASGEVKVNESLSGSISAVWGKRPNGLISLTIGGDGNQAVAPNGKKIGQFIVVISGRSQMQKGLDLQSRQDVSYWLAEMNQIAVESDSCSSVSTIGAGTAKNLALKKATATSSKMVRAELKKTHNPTLSSIVTDQPPLELVSQADDFQRIGSNKIDNFTAQTGPLALTSETGNQQSTEPSEHDASAKDRADENAGRISVFDLSLKENADNGLIGQEILSNSSSIAIDENLAKAIGKTASADTVNSISGLIIPERAIAGEPLSVSVTPKGESIIGQGIVLNFNDTAVNTDEEGKAIFKVPEDASPGKSLKVTLTKAPPSSRAL